MSDKKKILMLGTSYASTDMIKYAKEIGCHTIVTDYLDPEKSLAKKYSDEYWMINTGDLDLLEAKCRKEGIDAVICGISEFNLEMTMELCRRLGLPCYCTPEAWHYSKDKADFKAICKKVGAPVPEDFYVTDALTDAELDKIIYPVMVKPVDMSGNRGITYCYDKEDVRKAYKYARSLSKNDKIIVERMLHGEEWWAGYALADGEISLLSLNGMYAQPGEPKNCYTLTTTVSDHVEKFIQEINPKIIEVLKAVGCREGFAWVQVMLDKDGHFYIIEMGYRLTGEKIFIPLKSLIGFDTVAWLVDYALGKKHTPAELPPSQHKAFERCTCAMELWTNRGGVIKEIKGLDKISSLPGVEVESLNSVGSTINQYRPFGNVLFTCDTIDEMCDLVDQVNNNLQVLDEDGVDMIIKYTDFDYLKKVYERGLKGL